MALKTAHRNFIHMISGFPPHFISSDLMGLVYRALIDTCEQLSVIEPQDIRHKEEIALFTNKLAELSKETNTQRPRLDNPQQMKEIRQHLQELQRFVILQVSQKHINKSLAESHLEQIKRLNLQMAVDVYIHYAKQAQQSAKLRLAIHYYTLAKKLLVTENATRIYDSQITTLNGIIEKLEEKALLLDETSESEEAPTVADKETSKEWENYEKKEQEEQNWKKKQVYD
jgi:hypothetical protein